MSRRVALVCDPLAPVCPSRSHGHPPAVVLSHLRPPHSSNLHFYTHAKINVCRCKITSNLSKKRQKLRGSNMSWAGTAHRAFQMRNCAQPTSCWLPNNNENKQMPPSHCCSPLFPSFSGVPRLNNFFLAILLFRNCGKLDLMAWWDMVGRKVRSKIS